MPPFVYSSRRHHRRHGPEGYEKYEQYRDWLRDEFKFRCVYCLYRETWAQLKGGFHIEHFIALSKDSSKETTYSNLLYACASCNLTKGKEDVPDPLATLLSGNLIISDDGRIEGKTRSAKILIDQLDLDSIAYRSMRKKYILLYKSLVKASDDELLELFFGFPVPLPNLSNLNPKRNSRPGSCDESWHHKHERGELPKIYG
jgi:hypothetical protein